jgi:hypothetical protein
MNARHALGQFLRTLPHSAATTLLALFPIVDPFGESRFLYPHSFVDGERSQPDCPEDGHLGLCRAQTAAPADAPRKKKKKRKTVRATAAIPDDHAKI